MSKKGLDKFYNLVESFENLPSIGKKSALRLAYHIVYENSYSGLKLAHSIEDAIATIKKCTICNSMSEHEICDICLDSDRVKEKLCIVQSAKDIFNVEDSKQYDGTYFVLEHLDEENLDKLKKIIDKNNTKDIFNIEDSGQYDGTYFVLEHLDEENLDKLKKIIETNDTKDVLFAITPSLANDAFILYIEDRLKPYNIKFTKIAQGVPTGVSLENVDILSLSKAIKCSVEI